MQQLVDPSLFVNADVKIQDCFTDDRRDYYYRFIEGIRANQSKEYYIAERSYRAQVKVQPEDIDEEASDYESYTKKDELEFPKFAGLF